MRRAAILLLLVACGDVTRASVGRRDVASVPIDGDAQVTVSIALSREHQDLALTGGGGGRGGLPTDVRLPSDRWWPQPVVEVRRGGVRIALRDRHDSPATWFCRGAPHASEEEAARAAATVGATSCAEGPRLAYRLAGAAYDSGWQALYVRGRLAIHQAIATASTATCPAALAALPPLDAWLDAEVQAGRPDSCDLLDLSGRSDDAFACLLARPVAASPGLWQRFATEVAAGAQGRPDREGAVLACYEGPAAPAPGCARLLDRTSTAERRRALLDRQLRACGAEPAPAHCLDELTLGKELGRLADAALCGRALDRAERLVDQGGPERLGRASRLAFGVRDCAPPARSEALARKTFLSEEAPPPFEGAPFVCAREGRDDSPCASLPRMGARLRARDCAPADVERSRGALGTIGVGPLHWTDVALDTRADGALRVLAACAPEDARVAISAAVGAPLPRGRMLAEYGLAPASAAAR